MLTELGSREACPRLELAHSSELSLRWLRIAPARPTLLPQTLTLIQARHALGVNLRVLLMLRMYACDWVDDQLLFSEAVTTLAGYDTYDTHDMIQSSLGGVSSPAQTNLSWPSAQGVSDLPERRKQVAAYQN